MQQEEIGILHIFCICILACILILFWHQVGNKDKKKASASHHLTVKVSPISIHAKVTFPHMHIVMVSQTRWQRRESLHKITNQNNFISDRQINHYHKFQTIHSKSILIFLKREACTHKAQ